MSTGHPTDSARLVKHTVSVPQENPANYLRPPGCLPLPNGDAILTRAYIRWELGISFNTLTKMACDADDPLMTFGADTKNILIFASDLEKKIRSRGPNTKASRTAAHHAKRRKKPRATPKE